MALALETAEEHVRHAPDEHAVVGARGAFGLLGLEEGLHVERLARAERDVPIVREELRDRADFPRPLARSKQRVDGVVLGLVAVLRPDEHLRHEQNRPLALTLHLEDGSKEAVAFDLPARPAERRSGPRPGLEQGGRAFQEERRRGARRDREAQVLGVGGVVARERVQPAAAHRLEHPQPEIVGEVDLGELVALGQVVEGEEIDRREIPEDVDHSAARLGAPHRPGPRLVDLNVLEEPMVRPAEEGVGLVRHERPGTVPAADARDRRREGVLVRVVRHGRRPFYHRPC